jgi:hypothetical protein
MTQAEMTQAEMTQAEMTQAEIIKKMNEKGNIVFLNPNGKIENSKDLIEANDVLQYAIAGNTFRGFHRVDQSLDGASVIFRNVLDKKYTQKIVTKLQKITKEEDLNVLENEIVEVLKEKLKDNIKNDKLETYNRIRKPVDLFIENLVCLCKDFKHTDRERIIPWLFLPLDNYMFNSPIVFPKLDYNEFKIKRNFTMGNIKDEDTYNTIQNYLKTRAKELKLNHRIYFDLLWHDKYNGKGDNLWEIIQENDEEKI